MVETSVDFGSYISPRDYSYWWGLSLGMLTCSGFLLEAFIQSGQASDHFKYLIFLAAAIPFVIQAVHILSNDFSVKLGLPHFLAIILLFLLIAAAVVTRVLLLRLVLLLSLIVASAIAGQFFSQMWASITKK
jgi:hypothetical protein